MARYLFWFGVLCLVLGACGRAPAPFEGPQEEAGGRWFVFGDAEGTYVVDGVAGFLERYGAGGGLIGRTALPSSACSGCSVLDAEQAGGRFYLLTGGPRTVVISVLSPTGEEVSAYPLPVSGVQVADAAVFAGGAYVLSSTVTGGGRTWFVEAFGARWSKVWQRTSSGALRGGALAVSPQGDLYLGHARSLEKYGADGSLLWSRKLDGAASAHHEHLAVGGDGSVYYTRRVPAGASAALELTRFDAGGRVLWTRRLPTGMQKAGSSQAD